MEKKSVITRLDKVSSPDGVYLVLYRANGNFRAFNYLMEVLHIFDRQDLFHLFEDNDGITKENDQSDFWSNQQEWKIITWRLYEACGVCILELEDGIVIHMLVERRYPLSKELLQRMLDLGLEVERESTVALDLIRFIKQIVLRRMIVLIGPVTHEDEQENYAFMVTTVLVLDTEREQLGDANIEIQAYTQALKKVEAQLVAHQQGQLCQSSKPDKKDYSGLMSKKLGLGFGYPKKACFVCGSLSHLIRDCDFHEKKMAKQAELNNRMRKKSSQREIRPIWNNVQRMNHQNQFVPKAVLTRTRKILVNTGFNLAVLLRDKGKLLLSPQQVVIETTKDITGTRLQFTMVDQFLDIVIVSRSIGRLNPKQAWDWITRPILNDIKTLMVGPVAFGGSKGYITSKGKIIKGKLDFEDVCFVKELQHFNLFSVSQMCDKKNKVLFTDSECLVLSLEFKLPDEDQVLLRIPRQIQYVQFHLEIIIPSGGLLV
ncbi:hypothetical protein Tco_1182370 [Tanacetum coccineum]